MAQWSLSKNFDCYIRKSWRRIKRDHPLKSFTEDCFSFSQAAKHFNKLGKWDCKTTTSDSKPQGQEPFLKLILTQVLTLIRFQEENVPLSCLSVLRETLGGLFFFFLFANSEKRFSLQHIVVTGIAGLFCQLFLYSPRDALPQTVARLFSVSFWDLSRRSGTAPAAKPGLKPIPMWLFKDPTRLTSDLQPCRRHRANSDQLRLGSNASFQFLPREAGVLDQLLLPQAPESHCALTAIRASTDRAGILTPTLN